MMLGTKMTTLARLEKEECPLTGTALGLRSEGYLQTGLLPPVQVHIIPDVSGRGSSQWCHWEWAGLGGAMHTAEPGTRLPSELGVCVSVVRGMCLPRLLPSSHFTLRLFIAGTLSPP